MKALVGASNQEKAIVGAFSVIIKLHVDLCFKLLPAEAALRCSRPSRCWRRPGWGTWPRVCPVWRPASGGGSDGAGRWPAGYRGAPTRSSHLQTYIAMGMDCRILKIYHTVNCLRSFLSFGSFGSFGLFRSFSTLINERTDNITIYRSALQTII